MRDTDSDILDTFLAFCARYKEKVFEGYTQKEILVQVLEHYEQCVLDVAHNMHSMPYGQQQAGRGYSSTESNAEKTFCKAGVAMSPTKVKTSPLWSPDGRGLTPQQHDDRKANSSDGAIGPISNQAVFPCRQMEVNTSQQDFVPLGHEDRGRQSDEGRGSNGDGSVTAVDSPMIFPCRHIDATGQNPFVASNRSSIFNPLLHQSYFTTTTSPLMPPPPGTPLTMAPPVSGCPMTAPSPGSGNPLNMQSVTSGSTLSMPAPTTATQSTPLSMTMPPPSANPPRKNRSSHSQQQSNNSVNNSTPAERRHPCRECGKRFKQMSHLKVHQRQRHSSERPYACEVCEKRFARGCDLNRHSRSHSRAPMHHFVSQVEPAPSM